MVELDYAGFDASLARGTPEDFTTVSARLGVDVDVAGFQKISALCEQFILASRPRVLALIREVLEAPEGVAWECESVRGFHAYHYTFIVTAKWEQEGVTRVTVGIGRDDFGPGGTWSELSEWSWDEMSKNRERADAWARGASEDRVTFTVRSDLRLSHRDDDEALVRAIAERPDDENLRLVYADWLEERGDVRAELIRAQLNFAKTEDPGARERIRQILSVSWERLAGELRPWADRDGFKGGMLEGVEMSSAEFLKEGERIFSRHPLRELTVKDATADVTTLERIANSPVLGRLRALTLNCQHRQPLAALGRSPHLARLETLTLVLCGHSAKDWVETFSALRAPALHTITLTSVLLHASVWRAVAENASLTGVKRVRETSGDGYLPDEQFAAVKRLVRGDDLVAASNRFAARPGFEQLEISQSRNISDAMVAPFFEKSSRASLALLNLVGTNLTDATLRLISNSPRATTLQELSISDVKFSAGAVCALLRSSFTTQLRRLSISLPYRVRWTPNEFGALYETLLALPASHLLKNVSIPKNEHRNEAMWSELERRFDMYES